jgi:hypothetical protein
MKDYQWNKVSEILPEDCDFEKNDSAINKDFVVYISEEYDPAIAARCYDKNIGWYWEFGVVNPFPSDYADRVTLWMTIQLPQ